MLLFCLHMGVALTGRGQIERESPGFSGSGRPRAAGKPQEKGGGLSPPTFLESFPVARGRPNPENPRFSLSIWPPC